jgi:hypothetical protein
MSFSKLTTDLDNIFSKKIRLRDANLNGMCRCVSCGRMFSWKFMDNGHFISRRHMATRYYDKNNNAECVQCNREPNINHLENYKKGLIAKYGEGIIEELEALSRTTKKYSEFELIQLIEENKAEVKKLLKLKS